MIKTILPNNTFDLVLSFDLPDYCQNPTGPLSLLHPHYIFCIVRLVWFKSMQKLDMPTVILWFFLFRNKCQWFDSFQPLDIFFNNTWFTASQTSSQEHNQTSTSCKHVHSFDMTGLAIPGKPVVRYGCFNSEMVRLFLFWINPNTTKYKTCNVIFFRTACAPTPGAWWSLDFIRVLFSIFLLCVSPFRLLFVSRAGFQICWNFARRPCTIKNILQKC